MGLTWRKWFRWIHVPAWCWSALLFGLSSRPARAHGWILLPPWDKVAHFVAYAILSMTLCLWVRGARWQKNPWMYAVVVWSVVALFGALDEFHQAFVPGRSVSLADWLADISGALIGIGIYRGTKLWRWADRLYFQKNQRSYDA